MTDYRKIFLLIFLFQNDKDFIREVGFSERIITRVNLGLKNILIEQHEEYLDYVRNEEESIVERFLDK